MPANLCLRSVPETMHSPAVFSLICAALVGGVVSDVCSSYIGLGLEIQSEGV